MKILTLEEIESVLPSLDVIPEIESAFVAYSQGEATVPPVGELLFDEPPGDVHIKYGYLNKDEYYVIKIASGFYENPSIGLPSNNGLMLLFKKHSGQLEAILLDEGHLTDIRTAIAGAIAAKHLAKKNIERIGIVGTGIQALLQLEYLKAVRECREVVVWGRDTLKCEHYSSKAESLGFVVSIAKNANDLLSECELIVTTTPAEQAILTGTVKPGTHITAVGSDTPMKQELSTSILKAADRVVADSIAQCQSRGEIYHALQNGSVQKEQLSELGQVIAGSAQGRTSENEITIADLTGVAIQDIAIAKAVYDASVK